ncbi:hypothetical protein ACMXYR_12220 [Neptuniibacter sp. QD29_5]|uniref:hypothetical protein n=1 Tax=Neptuniibacter sp. QD29_5 TaxID=3398207 RepID=UPI0039F49DB7
MQRLILVLVIICIGVAGYLFIQKEQAPNTIKNADTPSKSSTQKEARQHIDRLTSGQESPIKIEQASNFVTADQLLKLPAVKTSTQAEILEEAESPQRNRSTAEAQGETFAVSSHLSVIKTGKNEKNTNATVANTALVSTQQIKLLELLDDPDNSAQKVYFIHAVNEGDDEGLWGIIQHGLMRTFTEGLSLPGLGEKVSVDIPKDADEALGDKRSSFLGQVLKAKVDQTYIYNYQKGILGENPNLIKPGQQLVIVTFTEQELIGIYHHFINQ